MTSRNSTPEVLLVEDNPGDVRLIQEAFRDAGFDVNLHIATDGVEAVAFLQDGEMPVPELVLLDLNLPRKDGLNVLAEIRNDPELSHLPVLVLSSSTATEDVVASYDQYANAYLTKPDDPNSFVELVQAIETFWLEQVRLPPTPGVG